MKPLAALLPVLDLVLSIVSYQMRDEPKPRDHIREVAPEQSLISDGRRRLAETTKEDMEVQRRLRTFEETEP